MKKHYRMFAPYNSWASRELYVATRARAAHRGLDAAVDELLRKSARRGT